MSELELPAEGSTPSAEDQRTLLASKVAQASQLYAHKAYEQAAEVYAEAAEIQAALNGEMAVENADLLYAYGRCLYHVAVSHSDVLGGKVAGEKANASQPSRGVKRKKTAGDENNIKLGGATDSSTQAASASNLNGSTVAATETQDSGSKSTPYFQIEGDDADWGSDSDESDADADADDNNTDAPDHGQEGDPGTAAEEEDDFATAYEILDVARVLLTRRLEATEDTAPDLRTIKETLADTHDLQSEISLESERFPAAVADSRASLALKLDLYPPDSNYIAEAHFKLSLALEFASVTQIKDENGLESSLAPTASAAESSSNSAAAAASVDRNTGVAAVDEEMRQEAVTHMESAIASTKLRLQTEKQQLADLMQKQIEAGVDTTAEPQKQDRAQKERDIADVESMIDEMEQRLVDLRQPAISLNEPGDDSTNGASDAVRGLLGSLLGETKDVRDARIQEATQGANDLTGLIKKKPKASSTPTTDITVPSTNGSAKRKAAEDTDTAIDISKEPTSKKVRLDDAAD